MGSVQEEVKQEDAAPVETAGEAAVDTAEETAKDTQSLESKVADLEDQVRDINYRMSRAGALLSLK